MDIAGNTYYSCHYRKPFKFYRWKIFGRKAQKFYDKHGGRAIIIGRFFPIIRTYIPFLAGMVYMERRLFLKNTIIGAILWISLFLLTGFFVGEITWVKNNYGLIFLSLIIITTLPLVFSLFLRRKSNSN